MPPAPKPPRLTLSDPRTGAHGDADLDAAREVWRVVVNRVTHLIPAIRGERVTEASLRVERLMWGR